MSDIVADTASAIADMRIRGAGKIARAGASAIGEYVAGYTGADMTKFRKDLGVAEDTILGSRPTAVSLRNGVYATMRGLDSVDDVESAKKLISRNAHEFVSTSLNAVNAISMIGAKTISDGDTVLTHCNSSAAVGIIIEAHKQGKKFKAYATETRPWRQGILTANALAAAGVDITLIVDSAVRTVMKDVTKVFVGADTITSDGNVINKIGTSQLALAANEARVPFYVCSETYKFSPMTVSGNAVIIEERDHGEVIGDAKLDKSVKIFNPVFDTTPRKYIDAIITEVGVISPGAVYGIIMEKYGDSVKLE